MLFPVPNFFLRRFFSSLAACHTRHHHLIIGCLPRPEYGIPHPVPHSYEPILANLLHASYLYCSMYLLHATLLITHATLLITSTALDMPSH